MEKLHEIMDGLSQVEYGMESLQVVVKALEEYFELEKMWEMKSVLVVLDRQIGALHKEMCECVDALDMCIIKLSKNEEIK